MITKKLFFSVVLSTWICSMSACSDCCGNRQTANCCPTTSCCSPCDLCKTVSCTKNCQIDCPTTTYRPPSQNPDEKMSIPQPQVFSPAPSKSDTTNHVSNINNLNGSGVITLNNSLSNTNTIHVPINITNVNTNNIKFQATGGSASGGVQPSMPAKPTAPANPKIMILLVRQPPVYIPQPPVYNPQPSVYNPPPPVNIPQPMPSPAFVGTPSTNSCCSMQSMGCCSMLPPCSFQCSSPCFRFC